MTRMLNAVVASSLYSDSFVAVRQGLNVRRARDETNGWGVMFGEAEQILPNFSANKSRASACRGGEQRDKSQMQVTLIVRGIPCRTQDPMTTTDRP
jgi:hypothetical protein